MNLENVLVFATKIHSGHLRDGAAKLPYIFHPVEVTALLAHVGGVMDISMLAAAILHDTLEDTPATADELRCLFGAEVTNLVVELTRVEPADEELLGKTKSGIWELRNGMLLAEISLMSPHAATIKLADRLSNIREAKITRTGKKLERYVRQTLQILETVPRKVNPPLWDAIHFELSKRPR